VVGGQWSNLCCVLRKALKEGMLTDEQFEVVIERVLADPDATLTMEDIAADAIKQSEEEAAQTEQSDESFGDHEMDSDNFDL